MEKEYYQPIVIKNFSKSNDANKQRNATKDATQKETVSPYPKINKYNPIEKVSNKP